MKKQLLLFGGFALLVIAVAIILAVKHNGTLPGETEGAEVGEKVDVPQEDDENNVQQENILDGKTSERQLLSDSIDWVAEGKKDPEVCRLEDFLDENDNESILAQAEFLAASESPVRRYSVIAPLTWVATPKAGSLLVSLLQDDNEEISGEAFLALEHVIDTINAGMVLDAEVEEFVSENDVVEFYDMCVNAISAASDEQSDLLMGKVMDMDVKLALPIYLDILDKGDAIQKEQALDYIDKVTNGDGVTNREEAILWLMKDQNVKRKDD